VVIKKYLIDKARVTKYVKNNEKFYTEKFCRKS